MSDGTIILTIILAQEKEKGREILRCNLFMNCAQGLLAT